MISKTIVFLFIFSILTPFIELSAEANFKDIKGHWAKADIVWMKEKGLVSGKQQGFFDPDTNVTRAEFAELLLRTLDIKPVMPETLYFQDTDPGKWYAATIETAYNQNLIGGYPDGTFLPNHPITRQEMGVLLVRALKRVDDSSASLQELNHFNDQSKIGNWAKEEIAIAVKKGLLDGLPNGKFAPNHNATRAQSVVTLKRLLSHIDPSVVAATDSLPLGVPLTEWKVDEELGSIFGISEDHDHLYVVSLDSLEVKKKIQLTSHAKDLEIFDGKLYITIPNEKVVDVIDMHSLERMDSLNVLFSPDQIAIDHHKDYTKLFYTEHSEASLVILSMYDLQNNMEETITKRVDGFPNNVYDLKTQYSHPDLVVDRTNHILYIGESSSSGSNIFAMDTATYLRSKGKERGYSYPFKKVIIDGNEIFYAGKKLKQDQLSYEVGTFPMEEIIHVKDQYVLTTDGIYHRDHFNKINSYRQKARLAYMDNYQNIYTFTSQDQTIKKFKLDLSSQKAANESDGHRLKKVPKMTKWIFDPKRPYAYAISEHENKLYYIRTDTLTIENEMFIGAEPSGIDLYGDKIYVTHFGTKDIYVTDRNFSNQYEIIPVGTYQEDIVVSQNKIYFESIEWMVKRYDDYEISTTTVKMYDLQTKETKELAAEYYNRYGNSDIELSEDEKILYVKELDRVKMIDTNEESLLKQVRINPFGGRLILDKNELFTSTKKLDGSNLDELGDSGDSVLAITDEYVLSKNNVYSRSDLSHVATLSRDIQLAGVDPFGNFLVKYSQDIYRYDSIDAFITENQVPLRFEDRLTDWVYDEENSKIYALTNNYISNKLIIINAINLKVEDEIWISNEREKHSSIGLSENQIFITYHKKGEIKLFDRDSKEIADVIKVEKPSKLFVSSDKLVYLSQIQREKGHLYVHDLETGDSRVLKDQNGDPLSFGLIDDFVYDPIRNEVITETSYYKDHRDTLTYTDLNVFNADTLELLQSAHYSDGKLGTNLVVDQEGIFLDYLLINRDNISEVITEFPKSIIYSTEQYAFDGRSIYNRGTGEKIGENKRYLRKLVVTNQNQMIAHEFNDHIFHIWDIEKLLK